MARLNTQDAASNPEEHDLAPRVREVIAALRPSIQADGGDLEFVNVRDDNTVEIRLKGACIGCPSAEITLQYGIEQNMRTYVPEIKGVVAVE